MGIQVIVKLALPVIGVEALQLLAVVNRHAARLEELYTKRDPLYREVADLVVETGRQDVQALVRELLAKLEERWKQSA